MPKLGAVFDLVTSGAMEDEVTSEEEKAAKQKQKAAPKKNSIQRDPPKRGPVIRL